MDTQALHQLSALLEVLAFALVTPEVLGCRRLSQLAAGCRPAARIVSTLGNALAVFGISIPAQRTQEEFESTLRSAMELLADMWRRRGLARILFLATLVPMGVFVGSAIVLVFVLRGPTRWWAAAPVAIGPLCQLAIARTNILVTLLQRGNIFGRPHTPKQYLAVLLLWFGFSFVLWVALPAQGASYALLRLSERRLLRGVLFGAGALFFTVAKAILFFRP